MFTTHDTNLNEPALRRDQIWLTEKDNVWIRNELKRKTRNATATVQARSIDTLIGRLYWREPRDKGTEGDNRVRSVQRPGRIPHASDCCTPSPSCAP